MNVRYSGPHTEGVTVVVGDQTFEIPSNAWVDVPDVTARALVTENPDAWELDKKKSASKVEE